MYQSTFIQIWQELTSPRSIQAVLVVMFGGVVCWLALQPRDVPDIVAFALSAIVGYYFGQERSGGAPTPPFFRPGTPTSDTPTSSAPPDAGAPASGVLDGDLVVVNDTLLVSADDPLVRAGGKLGGVFEYARSFHATPPQAPSMTHGGCAGVHAFLTSPEFD